MRFKQKLSALAVLVSMAFVSSGCSTTGKTDHHHHKAEYKGACAYSMAHGKHLPGKEELQVTYKGKTYYFSEPDMRDHFLDEIKSNVDTANKEWKKFDVGGGGRERP